MFPLAQIQLCVVHMVRASLNYVNWKERKQVVADLKPIYRAATAEEAKMQLDSFIGQWGGKYKAVGKLWQENWERVIPFFAFPPEVRKVIYTTNAVEALHRSLRKITKNRGAFPSEEAALKLLISGAAECDREMGDGTALAGGPQSVRDSLERTNPGGERGSVRP